MDDIWNRWGQITESLLATRLALSREQKFWENIELTNKSKSSINYQVGTSMIKMRLGDYLSSVENTGIVFSAYFVMSFALAESYAMAHLKTHPTRVAGIQDWGGKLLKSASKKWDSIDGGLETAVELGIVRNILVHGGVVDAANHQKLVKIGCPEFPLNSMISLDYETLVRYRAALKSLISVTMTQAE